MEECSWCQWFESNGWCLTGVVALPYQLSICQLVHRQVIDSVLKQTRKAVKDHLAGKYVQNIRADCEDKSNLNGLKEDLNAPLVSQDNQTLKTHHPLFFRSWCLLYSNNSFSFAVWWTPNSCKRHLVKDNITYWVNLCNIRVVSCLLVFDTESDRKASPPKVSNCRPSDASICY